MYTSNTPAKNPSDFIEDAARLIYKEIQTNPQITHQFIMLWMMRANMDAQSFKKDYHVE